MAFELGKSTKKCKHGETCKHKRCHLLPADIALNNENYSSFVVVHDHLKSQTAPENKFVAMLNNGKIPSTELAEMVGAPALVICDKESKPDEPEELELLQPTRSGITAAALSVL